MDTVVVFAFGSLKVLVLLVAAAGVTTALRKRSARLRVVVWSTALAGSLLIPLVAPILPPLSLPLPGGPWLLERTAAIHPPVLPEPTLASSSSGPDGAVTLSAPVSAIATTQRTAIRTSWLAVGWILGTLAVLSHLVVGLWRMERTVRQAPTVGNTDWQIDWPGPRSGWAVADRSGSPGALRSTFRRPSASCGPPSCCRRSP